MRPKKYASEDERLAALAIAKKKARDKYEATEKAKQFSVERSRKYRLRKRLNPPCHTPFVTDK